MREVVDKAPTRARTCSSWTWKTLVPPAEKERPAPWSRRTPCARAPRRRDVVVRINQPLSLAVRDIEHSICPDVDGIAITKADSASHVKLLDQLVTELEAKRGMKIGHTRFIVMIETADAFSRIDEIPLASPRVAAMNIGGEDFALDLNAQPDEDVLLAPKQRMIISARARGVCRWDSSARSPISATGRNSASWCALAGASASTAPAASIRGR